MRICAGIVLYYPDKKRLRRCINAVLPQVDKLVLINNTPGEDTTGLGDGSVARIENGENLGIAKALNQLLEYARENKFRWALTLDQDSLCADGMVDKLFEAAMLFDNVAMASPAIRERGEIWFEDWMIDDRFDPIDGVRIVKHCITSGALTNVEMAINAGGFDERLFIDEVDRDMCIRLRRLGLRLLRVEAAELSHEFGQKLVRRRILFKTFEYRNYSPFRVYYQTRNMVYMVRKYGADYKPNPKWRLIRPFFSFFVKFIFEPQRLKRLSAFMRGYVAGLRLK